MTLLKRLPASSTYLLVLFLSLLLQWAVVDLVWAMPATDLAAITPRLVVQTGHVGSLADFQFNSGDTLVATAGDDNTFKIWDLATGLLLRTLPGNTFPGSKVAFSPDNKTVACGSADGMLRLFSITDGSLLHSFLGMSANCSAIAFTKDSSLIAIGSNLGSVTIYRTTDGHQVHLIDLDGGSVFDIAFSPDDKTLAESREDSTVALWSVDSGHLIRLLNTHSESVGSVAFSSDGKYLATANSDNTIKLWNVGSGTLLRTIGRSVYGASNLWFSSDNKFVESIDAGGNGEPTSWSVDSNGGYGKAASAAEKESDLNTLVPDDHGDFHLQGTGDRRPAVDLVCPNDSASSVSFSSDGKFLAVGGSSAFSGEAPVSVWNLVSGVCAHVLRVTTDDYQPVVFRPGGHELATGNYDSISVWDGESGHLVRQVTGLHTFDGTELIVRGLCFSPDGKRLASGCIAGSIYASVGAGDHWTVTRAVQVSKNLPDNYGRFPVTTESSLTVPLTFLHGSTALVSCNGEDAVQVWDSSTGKRLNDLTNVFVQDSNGDAYAAGGRTDLSGIDGSALTWKMSNSKLSGRLKIMPDQISSVAVSPNSNLLACGGTDGDVRICTARPLKIIRTLHGHTGVVASAMFSPDGKVLATTSEDQTVRLWSVKSGKPLGLIQSLGTAVRDAEFSPDGRFIAAATNDGAVTLYSAQSLEPLCCLYVFVDGGWLVVTPDGRYDGSPAGLTQLHWVDGLNVAPLNKLHPEYFHPGLLSKLLSPDF